MSFRHGHTVLLHGDLDLHIIAAINLPNRDLFSERLRGCFSLCVTPPTTRSPSHSDDEQQHHPQNHHHHHHHHRGITSDPYVKVRVAETTVARTSVIHNCDEPNWDQHFRIPLAHCASMLEFVIKDDDMFGAQIIGTATVPVSSITSGEPFDNWLDVADPYGQPGDPKPRIHIAFKFTPVDDNPVYKDGITGDRLSRGVEDAYFPMRKGGQVTLYQDAHVRDGELPEIRLDGNRVFAHEKCWEDICHAILEARHLIYIVGWSIYTEVRLVRESTRPLPEAVKTLGELLRYKSEEGVRVCLLVWDDKTSNETLIINMGGLMQTHDEETRRYFKHSTVICVLSPRYPSSKLSIMKQQVVGSIYTHHQKCLILDTAAPQGNRKITAFIGGLDLCDGRYDTPQHRLFHDLDTVFAGDIHNPTFNAQNKGPRQPWHDLHCKIEGPAAYDVLINFEQRWRKATKLKLRRLLNWFSKTSLWRDDALIKIDRISWILSPNASSTDPYGDPDLRVSREEDPENWHVQIFRSIDSGSLKGVPEFSHRAETKSYKLVRGKNLIIDQSIHTAYVKAIRSAKHFIYIENQYFIGSSYGWPSKRTGADNLIPMELALKIVEKIRKRERFSVYIVIPMWPEGNPTSTAMQEILFWQGQTIMMMYAIIGRELSSPGHENEHPQHYLNFYCLGNREANDSQYGDHISENNPAATSARKHKRFMIYVHAKGMIVDDEYVIIGSANINQRSLDGSRDTEIAMGAYQPHHTWASNNGHPHGQVYGYRKSLWAEHLGSSDSPVLEEPQSLDCVKYVNKIADDNWARYTTDQNMSLIGHLLKYPINVEENGVVGALPGHEKFPDVGGKVLGDNGALPDELTM
ncbi:phospholipase D delta-like [Carex rostrata]